MVSWKNQREHYRGQCIHGSFSGRPGIDSTSSSLGVLHDFDGSRTRLLVLAGWHRQCVSSGIQRNVDEYRGAAVAS